MAFNREMAKEYLERFYSDRYKQRPIKSVPKCTCPLDVILFTTGCMCGGS